LVTGFALIAIVGTAAWFYAATVYSVRHADLPAIEGQWTLRGYGVAPNEGSGEYFKPFEVVETDLDEQPASEELSRQIVAAGWRQAGSGPKGQVIYHKAGEMRILFTAPYTAHGTGLGDTPDRLLPNPVANLIHRRHAYVVEYSVS
jgi:hypothetical protein